MAAPILYLLIVSGGRYGYLAAAVLFVVASFTDTLDGEVARRSRLVSPLGIYLDTTADKILIAVLLVALAVAHIAPGWMAAVIIAREFLVTGLRSYAAALGVVIPAGGWGKAKTLITINGARALGLRDYGLEPGCRADLVLFDAPTESDTIRLMAPRRLVIRGGKVVARTEPARHSVTWKGRDEPVDFMPKRPS